MTQSETQLSEQQKRQSPPKDVQEDCQTVTSSHRYNDRNKNNVFDSVYESIIEN